MGDTALAYLELNKRKKSRLEQQFDREEARAARNAAASRKREEKRKEREEKAKINKELKDLRELLVTFRRKQPVKITEQNGYARALFTFRGTEYHVQYSRWTIGEEGVDSWESKHEGWRLYTGRHDHEGHTLFENKDGSKPTPQVFNNILVSKLRDIQREQRPRG